MSSPSGAPVCLLRRFPRYADAALWDIALGASIAVSSVVSIALFDDLAFSPLFGAGVAAVIYAVVLYGNTPTAAAVMSAEAPPPPPSRNGSNLREHIEVGGVDGVELWHLARAAAPTDSGTVAAPDATWA